jgi:hypothetical protein
MSDKLKVGLAYLVLAIAIGSPLGFLIWADWLGALIGIGVVIGFFGAFVAVVWAVVTVDRGY